MDRVNFKLEVATLSILLRFWFRVMMGGYIKEVKE